MVARYFAYGSNMNPERVQERGIRFDHACGARLRDFALAFDKSSKQHSGVGHANVIFAPGEVVEGVLYWLETPAEIIKMDRFESTPVNYSREVVQVQIDARAVPESSATGLAEHGDGSRSIHTWTYFANPAVRRTDLVPPRSYLNHLLAGRPFLSQEYYSMLENWPCEETR